MHMTLVTFVFPVAETVSEQSCKRTGRPYQVGALFGHGHASLADSWAILDITNRTKVHTIEVDKVLQVWQWFCFPRVPR